MAMWVLNLWVLCGFKHFLTAAIVMNFGWIKPSSACDKTDKTHPITWENHSNTEWPGRRSCVPSPWMPTTEMFKNVRSPRQTSRRNDREYMFRYLQMCHLYIYIYTQYTISSRYRGHQRPKNMMILKDTHLQKEFLFLFGKVWWHMGCVHQQKGWTNPTKVASYKTPFIIT